MKFLPVLFYLLVLSPARSTRDMHARFELATAIAFYTDEPKEQEVLARIAWYESALRSDVAMCQTLGDYGKSLGLFQIQPQSPQDRRAACGSVFQQVQLALAMVRKSADACPGFTGADELSLYVSGKCVRGMREAKHRWGTLDGTLRGGVDKRLAKDVGVRE
jgi:hypothetical protein